MHDCGHRYKLEVVSIKNGKLRQWITCAEKFGTFVWKVHVHLLGFLAKRKKCCQGTCSDDRTLINQSYTVGSLPPSLLGTMHVAALQTALAIFLSVYFILFFSLIDELC